jgi:integrase
MRFLTGHPRFKNMPVRDFKTAALLEVREAMVKKGFIRKSINCHINRIRRMFAWGVEQELVKPEQLIVLKTVAGLKQGRSRAVESEPVSPVSIDHVDATKAFLRPVVWGMIQLQLLTGMRPGEVRTMRLNEVKREDPMWEYVPREHKTQHRGKQRRVAIGPEAQRVLQSFLKADQNKYVFESKPGKCYGKDSYIKAIARACEKAGIPKWSPNQLRHRAATEIRRQFGLEACRTILGHSTSDVTQIYAERDFDAARSVMAKIG